MKKILNFIDAINEWTGRIFSCTIAVLTGLVVLEVILRRFFGRPTIWNFEVTIQTYAFYALISAGYTLLHRGHVNIDVLYQKYAPRTRAVLDVITYIIFFFPFFSIMLYEGILYSANSWAIREKSWSVFSPPLYPIKTIIPIMAFLVLIQGIAVFIRQLHVAIMEKEL